MSPTPNTAIFVDADAQIVVRNDIPPGDAAPDELLVQTHFSGINPADAKHATHLGIRSTVMGYDFSGRVVDSPPGSHFRQGDLIAGYTPSGMDRPTKYGTHQDYLVVPTDMAFKVPAGLPETHAAALTTVTMTAADAIFNVFKFPLPTAPAAQDTLLLIWGASTAVGISALQFARASGCTNIFVTASPSRHELLKTLGATHVFDYSSPTVISDIRSAVEALGRGPITHALDAIGAQGPSSSADLVAQAAAESTELACVVLTQNKRFRMPVATTNTDWRIQPPGVPHVIHVPARPADHWNAWKGLGWAVEHYGVEFKFPVVDVVEGTAEVGVEEIVKVANGKRGFGKVVLKHPFK